MTKNKGEKNSIFLLYNRNRFDVIQERIPTKLEKNNNNHQEGKKMCSDFIFNKIKYYWDYA